MKNPIISAFYLLCFSHLFSLNILRLVNGTSTTYDWNFVDNKKGSYMMYDGLLEGIENIKPPTRKTG